MDTESKIIALNGTIEYLKRELTETHTRNTALEKQVDRLAGERDEWKADSAAMASQLVELKTDKRRDSIYIAQLEAQLTEALDQLAKVTHERGVLVSSINLLAPAMQSRLPHDMTLSNFALEHSHYKYEADQLREQLRQAEALANIYSEQAIRWQAENAALRQSLVEAEGRERELVLAGDNLYHSINKLQAEFIKLYGGTNRMETPLGLEITKADKSLARWSMALKRTRPAEVKP